MKYEIQKKKKKKKPKTKQTKKKKKEKKERISSWLLPDVYSGGLFLWDETSTV